MSIPIQCKELPHHKPSEFVVVATPEEAPKYLGKGYADVVVVKHMSLAWAIEVSDCVLLETDFGVVMDDINKFSLPRACHMERGSMMKAFLMKTTKLRNKVIMRTDEILPSLNELIQRIHEP